MKKILLAISFTFIMGVSVSAASLYILYDPACMDRLEYSYTNNQNGDEYVVYHVNTSPGVKIILEVGTESTTPQDFPPAQVIRCNNAVFDEKLVNAINSNIDRVFMVVKKGNNRYFISPITFAARYLRAEDFILYDSPKYRFQFDTKLGTIGENIAYKNPKAEVYFEGMLQNQCSGTLLFRQKAEFAGNPHTNMELIPEIGIVEERSGINVADAMQNRLRLEKVNGKNLERYMRQLCTGEEEPVVPEEPLAAAGERAPGEFITVGARAEESLSPKGGASPQQPVASQPAAATNGPEYHIVKKGETLYSISKQHGVALSQLREWNKKGGSNIIVPGEKLQVSAASSSMTAKTGDMQAANIQPSAEYQQPANAQRLPSGGSGAHIVRSGETVASIAMKYGYTESRFREFNNLGKYEVAKVGQKLFTSDCDCPQDPATGYTSPGVVNDNGGYQPYNNNYNTGMAARPPQAARAPQQMSTEQGRIQEENFSQDELNSRNYAGDYDHINTPMFLEQALPPPQQQQVPSGYDYGATGGRIDTQARGGVSGSLSGRSPTFNGTPPAQTSPTPSRRASSNYYIVKEGDTLYSIARRYGITVERLREVNNLALNEVIVPYQKIYLN